MILTAPGATFEHRGAPPPVMIDCLNHTFSSNQQWHYQRILIYAEETCRIPL
jgi:hypothetical protein